MDVVQESHQSLCRLETAVDRLQRAVLSQTVEWLALTVHHPRPEERCG